VSSILPVPDQSIALGSYITEPAAEVGGHRKEAKRKGPFAWSLGRLLLFIAASIRLAYGDPRLLRTHLVGNPGDAFLVDSILQWGASKATSGYRGYWQGPYFAGSRNVMAFSEAFLPLTPLFRVFTAVTGSTTLAMNLLYLLSWVLTAEATYHLVLRLTHSQSAAFVGALAFTFSTIRLSQSGHFQLAFAFFIPFTLLILFRAIDEPSIGRGAWIGVSIACQFLTSAYYGVILALCVVAIAVFAAATRRQRGKVRPILRCWLTAGFTLALLVMPIGVRYLAVQSATQGRGQYIDAFALKLGDLHTADPQSRFTNKWSFLHNSSATRSTESYAYVGGFVLLLLPAFFAAMVMSKAARARVRRARFEIGALGFVGAIGLLVAVGRGPILGIHMPFYDIARRVVPGVRTMLAIVRLVIFLQLTLVCLAAIGLALVLRQVRHRVTRMAVTIALCGLVLIEASGNVPLVRVPVPLAGSTYVVLRGMPKAVIVELPMPPPATGVVHAFIESSRQLVGANDGQRTLNGYSGYVPVDYGLITAAAADFPSVSSIEVFRAHAVKYVVLHTEPLDTGLDHVSEAMNASGFAFVSSEKVETIIAQLPSDQVAATIKTTDSYIFVLR
jgi:Dolichyl-phosphate-mannose-protein mannosyltransferase